MSSSRLRLVIWALLVLAFGLAVGFMQQGTKASSEPEQDDVLITPPTGSPPASTARSSEIGTRLEAQETENRELEQRKRDLELGLAAARSSAGLEEDPVVVPPAETGTAQADVGAGEGFPFPANLREPYTPKGFENVALRAVRECGMPLSVVAIDCSEFPCIAWTRVTGPTEPEQPFSMEGCAPWTEAFEHRTMVVGSVSKADVEPREVYFAWIAIPEQEDLVRPAMARARERIAHMKTAMELQ